MPPKKDAKAATLEEVRVDDEDAGESELAERNFLIGCLRTQLGQCATVCKRVAWLGVSV